MKKYLTRCLLVVFGLLIVAATLIPGKAGAVFNANNLMDDSVFNNSSSMDAGQIDTFLNAQPSSCISTNNGFSAPNVVGYNPSQGFL